MVDLQKKIKLFRGHFLFLPASTFLGPCELTPFVLVWSVEPFWRLLGETNKPSSRQAKYYI